jgi:urate oxidase
MAVRFILLHKKIKNLQLEIKNLVWEKVNSKDFLNSIQILFQKKKLQKLTLLINLRRFILK